MLHLPLSFDNQSAGFPRGTSLSDTLAAIFNLLDLAGGSLSAIFAHKHASNAPQIHKK